MSFEDKQLSSRGNPISNLTPSLLFPGFTLNTESISLPFSVLPGLKDIEMNPTLGDGRAVALALIEQIFVALDGLDSENRPLGLNVTKNNPVGSGINQVTQTYTISFTYTYSVDAVNFLGEPLTVAPIAEANF